MKLEDLYTDGSIPSVGDLVEIDLVSCHEFSMKHFLDEIGIDFARDQESFFSNYHLEIIDLKQSHCPRHGTKYSNVCWARVKINKNQEWVVPICALRLISKSSQ